MRTAFLSDCAAGLVPDVHFVLEGEVQRERREGPRFAPKSLTYVVLGPHFGKLGKLIDIGHEGLTFHYVALKEGDEETTECYLFTHDKHFGLPNIPCRVVYDIREETVFWFENRRCGLRFGNLTDEQRTQLEAFITSYTDSIENEGLS
jgi:hypothetical protein